MNIPMMKCGCSGVATHGNAHDGLKEGHPSCIVHECCEVVDAPNLEGRLAGCTYYGKSTYKNECNVCKDVCHCERPSDINKLAFFQHKPKEDFDEFYCGCHSWD